MATVPFDTLKFSRALQQATFSKEQADGLTEIIAEIMTSDLATRTDIKRPDTNIKIAMERLDAKFDALTSKLIKLQWTMGLLLAGEIAVLIKLFLS